LKIYTIIFKYKTNYDADNKYHRLGDMNIETKMNAKLDQLLVWLVRGSVAYFKDGLGETPDTILKATSEYMDVNPLNKSNPSASTTDAINQ
jgi:hypothetical protein